MQSACPDQISALVFILAAFGVEWAHRPGAFAHCLCCHTGGTADPNHVD